MKSNNEDIDLEFEKKMVNLSTRCLLNNKFKSLHASSIATAIIFEVRKEMNILPVWRKELTILTSHNPSTDRSVISALELIREMSSSVKSNTDVNNPETCVELNNLSLSREDIKPEDVIDFQTPDNNNKENKSIKEAMLSPVTIANLDIM